MPEHKFVVLSNPLPGQEENYNRWYNETHLPDVLKVPGIVSAQRFRFAVPVIPAGQHYGYLAIYEIDAEDPQAVIDEVNRRSGTAEMMLEGIDFSATAAWVFSPIAEKLSR